MAGQRFVGDSIRTFVGLRPVAAQAAATLNGLAIDRTGALSCEVIAFSGADTGAPSARNLACTLEDSADGATGWAAIPGATVPTVTAVNSEQRLAFDLSVTSKGFIRVVHVVSFTGGTTPTLFIGSTVVIGGYRSLPK